MFWSIFSRNFEHDKRQGTFSKCKKGNLTSLVQAI